MTRSAVRAVAHFVPERVVTNDDLAQIMNTSDAWIRERTGIEQRRFVESGTKSSELGFRAAERVLADSGVDRSKIDLVVAATLSPDHYFPGIGCQIQDRLELGSVPALDIRAQCSGFVYGLATADAFIRSGQAKTVLVVCAEVQSQYLNLSDDGRDTAVIFGDGAAALILEEHSGGERGIIDSILRSDGSGAESLTMRTPDPDEFKAAFAVEERRGWHPFMDGRQVFKHAVSSMGDVAEEILQRNHLSADDVSLLIPHQANLRINEMVRERLGLPPERVFNNIQRFGNTTAATIPIALSEAVAEGKLKSGDLLLTVAFGAGYTWGANLIRW